MGQKDASATAFQMKARNGFSVRAAENGGVEVTGTGGVRDYTPPMAAFAVEEFCQAKHDAELGRWRDPLDPHLVVYRRDGEHVRVIDERTGDFQDAVRGTTLSGSFKDAARAYFEAHPERKPWHEAEPGEVWVLTVRGFTLAWVADGDGDFQHLVDPESIRRTDPEIMDGRRIWPEDAS